MDRVFNFLLHSKIPETAMADISLGIGVKKRMTKIPMEANPFVDHQTLNTGHASSATWDATG